MSVTFRFLKLSYCEERGITEWDFDELPEELQVGPLAVRLAKQYIQAWQHHESKMRMKSNG